MAQHTTEAFGPSQFARIGEPTMKFNRPFLRVAASLILTAALLAGLFTGPATESAVAATSKQVSVNLNLRSGSSTSYRVIMVLKKGVKVSVTSTKGSWSRVVVGKKKGWVASRYLKPVPKRKQAASKTGQSFKAAGTTSSFHLYTPSTRAPKGILFYLDGDGQWAFNHPTSAYALGGAKGIVAKARQRGFVTVVVRTPDRKGTATWWEDGAKNAAYFDALQKRAHALYPTAKKTWLAGYSGGAQFITQSYLPQYPAAIRRGGGAVLLGGGGVPELRVKGFNKKHAAAFPMYWYTGAADVAANSDERYDALGEAKRGKSWYAKTGFRTASRYPSGVDHDLTGRFGSAIATAMDS